MIAGATKYQAYRQMRMVEKDLKAFKSLIERAK